MIADALRDGLAVWPVVIPLGAAALTVLLRHRPALQRGVMEGAVGLTLAAAAVLMERVERGGPVVMEFGDWGAPFGITAPGFSNLLLSWGPCCARRPGWWPSRSRSSRARTFVRGGARPASTRCFSACSRR